MRSPDRRNDPQPDGRRLRCNPFHGLRGWRSDPGGGIWIFTEGPDMLNIGITWLKKRSKYTLAEVFVQDRAIESHLESYGFPSLT